MSSTIQLSQRYRVVARAGVPAAWAGAAALGYVIGSGVENMELLRAPLPGAAAADIRAAYADSALALVTALAGVAALLLYVVFAAALAPRLRWPRVALVAGLAGPALAFAGIIASAPLVLDGGAGMSDAEVRSAFEAQHSLRQLAGPMMALFLFTLGSSDVLPRRLALAVRAGALPLAFAPLALAIDSHVLDVAANVAFGLDALCIWLVSLWLTVGVGVTPAAFARRAAFLMLVVAAGLVGLALLIVPRSAAAFFAWGLAPESLAAFAGGVYVGSAALYAAGLRAPWRQARALVAAAVVLSVSVFTITLVHLDVFDLGRLQAWAWLVLFAGFGVTTIALLVIGGRAQRSDSAEPPSDLRGVGSRTRRADSELGRPTRALFAAVAVALLAVGVGLWIDPTGLPPLGGRFAGSWTVMLGFLAGWAAVANTREEAWLPALALVALPAGALLAAARTLAGDPLYVAGLALLLVCGAAVLRLTRPHGPAVS